MAGQDNYLTQSGFEKLMLELEQLKTVKRRQLSKAIGLARQHGDIGENAEYDAAKEAQGLNEKRISELEGNLANARIIDQEDIPKDQALVGARLDLKDLESGEEMQYTLVSELEADYNQGKISISSPVGKALLGHREEEVVEISVPSGVLKYKILRISR